MPDSAEARRNESSRMKNPRCVFGVLTCAVTLLQTNAAWSQADLAGVWNALSNQEAYEHGYGPDLGAYMGVPLNAEGRSAALTYIGDKDEELRRQCAPWLVNYLMFSGVNGLNIWPTRNPIAGNVVAWHLSGNGIDRLPVTIWVDGRAPPPPQALHTYSGYSTGKWEGDTLVATTTHIKDGFLDRNGLPASNQQTIKFFIDRHDDVLTITALIRDPVYLQGPLPLSQAWQLDPDGAANVNTPPMACIPAETVSGLSDGYHWISVLPWRSTARSFQQKTYNIPADAAMGGIQTMYPDFRQQLDREYKPPSSYCEIGCCNSEVVSNPSAAVCKSLN